MENLAREAMMVRAHDFRDSSQPRSTPLDSRGSFCSVAFIHFFRGVFAMKVNGVSH